VKENLFRKILRKIYFKFKLLWNINVFRLLVSLGRAKWALKFFNRIPLPEPELDIADFQSKEKKLWGKYVDQQGKLRLITLKSFMISFLKFAATLAVIVVFVFTTYKLVALFYNLQGKVKSQQQQLQQQTTKQWFQLVNNDSVIVDVKYDPVFKGQQLFLPTITTYANTENVRYFSEDKFLKNYIIFQGGRFVKNFELCNGDVKSFYYPINSGITGYWLFDTTLQSKRIVDFKLLDGQTVRVDMLHNPKIIDNQVSFPTLTKIDNQNKIVFVSANKFLGNTTEISKVRMMKNFVLTNDDTISYVYKRNPDIKGEWLTKEKFQSRSGHSLLQYFKLTNGDSTLIDMSRLHKYVDDQLHLIKINEKGKRSLIFEKKLTGNSIGLKDKRIARDFIQPNGDTISYVYAAEINYGGTWMPRSQLTDLISPPAPVLLLSLTDKAARELRSKPDKDSTLIITIPENKQVEFLNFAPLTTLSTKFLWLLVRYTDKSKKSYDGWIPFASISKSFVDVEADSNTVIKSTISFRKNPNSAAAKIPEISRFAEKTYVRFLDSAPLSDQLSSDFFWIKVHYRDKTDQLKSYQGWIAVGKMDEKYISIKQ